MLLPHDSDSKSKAIIIAPMGGRPRAGAIGRPLAATVFIVLLAVGVVSIVYFSGSLIPKQASTSQAKVVYVDIPPYTQSSEYSYLPRNVTVVVGVNNTVIWTNDDKNIHGIVEGRPFSQDGTPCTPPLKESTNQRWCPLGYPLFDSGDLRANSTFIYTFTHSGVYEYFDPYIPFYPMIGFVVVK